MIVKYVGFEAKAQVREYTFVVRGETSDPLEYIMSIANEAFESHRARYQDAPDICSLRLHRELALVPSDPPTTHFSVTDAELAEYHDARKPKSPRGFQPPHRAD
jgi:hypothetical protein